MYVFDNYLVLKNEADLMQLKEESTTGCRLSHTRDIYHYYKGAFIRTYDLTDFPAYYKRSLDGHTWDRISYDYFKELVITDLDILTNKKRQLVGLLEVIRSNDDKTTEESR